LPKKPVQLPIAPSEKLAKTKPAKRKSAKLPAAVKKEQKRLSLVRKATSRKGLAKKLSPEALRFTAYSRNRRRVIIAVIASFSALIALVLATIFTPLLAVKKISVAGEVRLSEKSILNAIKDQMGKPLPMISSEEIGVSLKAFPLIESFSVVSLPPHGLLIQITERQPICIIRIGGVDYLYDPAGVRIGKATAKDRYPTVSVSGDPSKSEQYQAAVDVLLALPVELFPKVYSMDAKSKDNVTMVMRGYAKQRVIWGDSSQSVLKSKALSALIANQKANVRVTYDVSSPNAPTENYSKF